LIACSLRDARAHLFSRVLIRVGVMPAPGLVALLLAATTASQTATSPYRERLHELFHSISHTHGGPAYVRRADLLALRREAEKKCGDDEETYLRACRWAVQQLSDPLATFLAPDDADALRERFHGPAHIGIELGMTLERRTSSAPGWWATRGWVRRPTVLTVDENSPAEAAGVRPGDRLLAVGGTSVAATTLRAAAAQLEVPEGCELRLTLASPCAAAAASSSASVAPEAREVRLTSRRAPPPTVSSRPLPGLAGAHLVSIAAFSASTAAELRRELRRLCRPAAAAAAAPPPRCLVFDVRGNEGGLLTQAVAAARLVLPLGAHVLSLQKHAPCRTARRYYRRWYHRSALPRVAAAEGGGATGGAAGGVAGGATAGGPPALLVLVDSASASSAEIFAGALATAGGATVLGMPTYGKGTSQAMVSQPDGYAVSFTAYTLSVGCGGRGDIALHPLTRGVTPHVPWRWRKAHGARGADDAEVTRAVAAALAYARARPA